MTRPISSCFSPAKVCTRTVNAITGACGPPPQDTIDPGNGVTPPSPYGNDGANGSDGSYQAGDDSGLDGETTAIGDGDDVDVNTIDDLTDVGSARVQLTPVQMIIWIAIGMISLPFCCIIFCCCCCHRRRWCLFSGKRGSSDSDSDSDGSDSDSAVDSENASDSSDSLEVMSRASRGSRGSYNSRHSRSNGPRSSQQQQYRAGGANTGGMMGRGIENSNRVPINPVFQQQQQQPFQIPQPPPPQGHRQIPAPPPVSAAALAPRPSTTSVEAEYEEIQNSTLKTSSTPGIIAASFTATSPRTKTMKKFTTDNTTPEDFLRRQQYHQQKMGAFEPTNSSSGLNYSSTSSNKVPTAASSQPLNKLVPEPEPDFENSSVGSLRERELMGEDQDSVPSHSSYGKKKNPSYVSGGAAVNRRVSEPEFEDKAPTNPRLKKTSPQPSPTTGGQRKQMYYSSSSSNKSSGAEGAGGHLLGPQFDSLVPPAPIQMPPPSLEALTPPLPQLQMPPPSLDALVPPSPMPPPPAPPIENLNQHYKDSPPRKATLKSHPTTTSMAPPAASVPAHAGNPNPYFSSTRPEQPLPYHNRGPDIYDDDVSIGSASIGSVSTTGTSGTRGRSTDDGDAGLKQSRRKKSKEKKRKSRSGGNHNNSRLGTGREGQNFQPQLPSSSYPSSSRPGRPMPHFDD